MRKGQVGNTFTYLMTLIVGVSILFIGLKLYGGISEQECKASLVTFKKDLQEVAESTGANRASGVEETFEVPCGVDRVLIFDRSKGILFDGLERYPVIENILHSPTKENVFFLKNGELYESLYIEDVNIKVPYFLCASTEQGALKLLVKSTFSGETSLWPQDHLSDCTYEHVVPQELSMEDTLSVLQDIFKENETVLNKTVVDPVATGLTRDVRYKEGETIINISKRNGSFSYYESIPKCAIESLQDAAAAGAINITPPIDQNLSDDPLIMWQFDEGGKESVRYKVEEIIPPVCLRGQSPGLFGVGLADERYPNVSPSKRHEVEELRYKLRLDHPDNMPVRVLDSFERKNDQRIADLKGPFKGVRERIRTSNISQAEKLAYLDVLDALKSSLDVRPSQAKGYLQKLIHGLDSSGLNVSRVLGEKLNRTLISVTRERRFIKRLSLNLTGSPYPGCDAADTWCFDGSNATQFCLNRTHTMLPYCNNEDVCTYDDSECSGANEVCQGGSCVPVTPGSCQDAGTECTDKYGNVFHSSCNSDYGLRNYSCNSTGHCEMSEPSCFDGGDGICHNGECVPQVEECEIVEEDGWVNCTEGGDVRKYQTCAPVSIPGVGQYLKVIPVECEQSSQGGQSMEQCAYGAKFYIHPDDCECSAVNSAYSGSDCQGGPMGPVPANS